MNYKVEKKIVCEETGEELKVGDEVSIQYHKDYRYRIPLQCRRNKAG